jgi:hypothetical protein
VKSNAAISPPRLRVTHILARRATTGKLHRTVLVASAASPDNHFTSQRIILRLRLGETQ